MPAKFTGVCDLEVFGDARHSLREGRRGVESSSYRLGGNKYNLAQSVNEVQRRATGTPGKGWHTRSQQGSNRLFRATVLCGRRRGIEGPS